MSTRKMLVSTFVVAAIAVSLAGCGGNDNNNNDNGGPERTATPHPGATPTHTATNSTPVETETVSVTATPVEGTATPVEGTATPVDATATPGEPTATATPVAGGCATGDQIVVKLSLTQAYSGVNLFLAYPPAANIPGTGTAASVKERVAFANSGGLTTAGDLDQNADGVDDTLSISVVNTDNFDPGLFATVTFDCQAGQAMPSASDFSCTVQSASTSDGTQISNETCTVTVQ